MTTTTPLETTEAHAVPERGDGMRKAAILILAVGDELANEIFTRLTEREIRDLAEVAKGLRDVTPDEVVEVLSDFKMTFGGGHIPRLGAGTVFQLMVERALGEDRAQNLLHIDMSENPFELCDEVDPGALTTVLTGEHPQTVAIVLSAVSAEQAGAVLENLSPEMGSEIVYRMANLGMISEEVKRDIGGTLTAELAAMNVDRPVEATDMEAMTVDVVKALPRAQSDEIFAMLEAKDGEFARQMRSKIFTFDDLAALDARQMQRLLREIESKMLALALKGASMEIEELIFSAMSSRAAEMLRDDIDAMGPTRITEVEEAQEAIMTIALRLEEDGIITLPRGGDSELV